MKKTILLPLLCLFAFLLACIDEPVKDKGPLPADYLVTGCYLINEDSTGVAKRCRSDNELYYLNPAPVIEIKHFKEILMSNQGGFLLNIYLNPEGDRIFSETTEKSIGKRLAFVVDNSLMMTPRINEKITGGSILIDGGFTEEEMLRHYKEIKNSMEKYQAAQKK